MTITQNEHAAVQSLQPRVPGRTGQATAVEQSRAVAEVEAAVVVAQRFPRNVPGAVEAMREACGQMALAEKAFYRYPRGGQTVSGPSIHLARELARVWGNVQYGIAELRRDDDYRQSEMLAFAWDIQTNTRNSNTFIVPHKRDRTGGPAALTDMRDIYENNANNGARRVREAIYAVLPAWFTDQAQDLCNATLAHGGGKPLPQRIADAIAAFGKLGITPGQLEQKIGRESGKWIDQDVAQLQVIFKSLQRGEVTRDDEFPPERVTAADITGQSEPHHGGPKATTAQVGKIQGEFKRLGFTDDERDDRLAATAALARLPGLDSVNSLTKAEAHAVIEALTGIADRGELMALLIDGVKPVSSPDA